VKNIAWRNVSGAWEWRYASLTAGMLVWPEILDALAAAGYRGGFSIDHLSGRPTPRRLRAETEGLRALLSAVSTHAADAVEDFNEKGAVPSPASA
jgi:sugar phosphate isomerase/epimerase